jgi:sugar/nucleoside kinase (ribokinase family)
MLIIGHITQDSLVYQGKTTGFTGGAAYFAAFAARRSNAKICVVTKLAKKDFGVLDDLRQEGMEVDAIPSPKTTSIENIFETDDLDRRKVKLISQADPFCPQDLPEGDARNTTLEAFRGEISSLISSMLKEGGRAMCRRCSVPAMVSGLASRTGLRRKVSSNGHLLKVDSRVR